MRDAEYVSKDEVRKVCKALGLRDWSRMKKPEVSAAEARIILKALDPRDMDPELEDFRMGLEVELEHGTMYADTNVTNNHPLLTGKIVLAHMKETLDYYRRLEVMELEGDLLKAMAAGKAGKAGDYFRRLLKARLTLSRTEAGQV
ncbi:MAG: hypothetical protein Kow0025_03640 [Thermodesulfovibrionales bacterium]